MKSKLTPASMFRMGSAVALLALVGMVSAQAAPAAAAAAAPAAAAPAAAAVKENITLEARGHGKVEKTTVVTEVPGPTAGTTATKVVIPDGTEGKKWRVQAKGTAMAAIAADKPVFVTFMARSPGSNKMLVMVHTGDNPDVIKLISDQKLTPEWKSYKIKGEKPNAIDAGAAVVQFDMGEAAGEIEIANVVLTQ